jgi:hypothetical protein
MRRISSHEHFVLQFCQAIANRPIGQIAASLARADPGGRNEKAGFHMLSGRTIAVDYSIVSAINKFSYVR